MPDKPDKTFNKVDTNHRKGSSKSNKKHSVITEHIARIIPEKIIPKDKHDKDKK